MFSTPPTSPQWWRAWLLGVLVVGIVGTLVELLLLGHYDDRWQIAPLAIDGVFLIALTWYGVARSARLVHAIRWISAVACISAAVGVYFHFVANVEWELETTPEMGGFELFREVVTGALPLLAPGAMLQLGLLGLLWSFRHPLLLAVSPPDSTAAL